MDRKNTSTQNVSERSIQAVRRGAETTPSWACSLCLERPVFNSTQSLWEHAQNEHLQQLPSDDEEIEKFRAKYEAESSQKTTTKYICPFQADCSAIDFLNSLPERPYRADRSHRFATKDKSQRKSVLKEAEPLPKRPLSTPPRCAGTHSISGLAALNLGNDVDENSDSQPRKRAALGDGISDKSASSSRDSPPPPRRSKARPASASYAKPTVEDEEDMHDIPRPTGARKQLWTESDAPLPRLSAVDTSNIASVQVPKARKALSQPKASCKSYQTPQNARKQPTTPNSSANKTASSQSLFTSASDDNYDIILQPQTRPISQERLVAEVRGIYTGLVMVEAKCIEVDNQKAVLSQADPQAQPKLNNEQWQALIALHRTLLHEHHDFFLASQHPNASPALRRLASKYSMPARMWRHGIHSFLELLRHRLPASLDPMLAFIYLAYSMMALLYETVPAFEDTWIECLGDLGRYRMAIEDNDIRDREVWTGVARHWYSKASDKAPTTGRLYHHLAILARPNALQQLFYYSKSLCVAIPFVSARESILTLFNPVLDADKTHSQLRLPPLDGSFVKAHGLLFTNKHIEKFEEIEKEFLGLLDNQIGRVTKVFMEQGSRIAIANVVALTGFAAKDNALMQIISPNKDGGDATMTGVASQESMTTFKLAQGLHNATLKIVLERIGDPNVLPFLHIILVFMFNMTRHSGAMDLLQEDFHWKPLAIMLNTLLAQYKTPNRIESEHFPMPAMDDPRPFPEDCALRGFLWAENYYPAEWFTHEKIDEEEEEKHHERASMMDERKERILWLACRIAKAGPWLRYDGTFFKA